MTSAMKPEVNRQGQNRGDDIVPALVSIAISLKRIADIMQQNIVTVSAETEEDIQASLDRLAASWGINQ